MITAIKLFLNLTAAAGLAVAITIAIKMTYEFFRDRDYTSGVITLWLLIAVVSAIAMGIYEQEPAIIKLPGVAEEAPE